MAFKEKGKSAIVSKAENRLNGMQVVEANQGKPINYGNDEVPLNAAAMSAQIELVESKRADYNKVLKTADEKSNEYYIAEKMLNEMCTKVLSGAVSKFGDDSVEYEQLGGTRKSDRKKAVKKPAASGNSA